MWWRAQARIVLLLLVVSAYLPAWIRHRTDLQSLEHEHFMVPPPVPLQATAALFQAELITPAPAVAAVHVASLCQGLDGTLFAAWYGGSHEGARDVNIYWSRRGPAADQAWSAPRVLVSRQSAAHELQRPIKKVGNAMLFADGSRLRLIYVTVSIGGWSTSSLNLKTSRDGGQNWETSRRLTLSPFFNFSELVKNQPSPMSDGSWSVPIYHECLGKFPELLRLQEMSSGELSYGKSRVCGGRFALQPALVPLSDDEALALCRDSSRVGRIRISRTSDAASHWSIPEAMSLPNSDSGLDAVRLSDGRLVLAYNEGKTGRDTLSLALSEDGGRNWKRQATLESEPGAEFSYPYLLQARDGRLHLVYTWRRKSIKHASFNTAWLAAQEPKTSQARSEAQAPVLNTEELAVGRPGSPSTPSTPPPAADSPPSPLSGPEREKLSRLSGQPPPA